MEWSHGSVRLHKCDHKPGPMQSKLHPENTHIFLGLGFSMFIENFQAFWKLESIILEQEQLWSQFS